MDVKRLFFFLTRIYYLLQIRHVDGKFNKDLSTVNIFFMKPKISICFSMVLISQSENKITPCSLSVHTKNIGPKMNDVKLSTQVGINKDRISQAKSKKLVEKLDQRNSFLWSLVD